MRPRPKRYAKFLAFGDGRGMGLGCILYDDRHRSVLCKMTGFHFNPPHDILVKKRNILYCLMRSSPLRVMSARTIRYITVTVWENMLVLRVYYKLSLIHI